MRYTRTTESQIERVWIDNGGRLLKIEGLTENDSHLASNAVADRLCDLKKSLRQDLASYAQSVIVPTHVCIKCGRAANRKKLLCEPAKLSKLKR